MDIREGWQPCTKQEILTKYGPVAGAKKVASLIASQMYTEDSEFPGDEDFYIFNLYVGKSQMFETHL